MGRNGAGFAFGLKKQSHPRFLNTSNPKVSGKLLETLEDLEIKISPQMILEQIKSHDEKFDIKYIE